MLFPCGSWFPFRLEAHNIGKRDYLSGLGVLYSRALAQRECLMKCVAGGIRISRFSVATVVVHLAHGRIVSERTGVEGRTMKSLAFLRRRVSWSCCAVALVLCVGTVASATLPADPDNAAFLYYQAVLRLELYQPPYPSCPAAAVTKFVVHRRGGENQVREYLDSRIGQGVVVLAEKATQMPRCDWGFTYSLGWVPDDFVGSLRKLGFVLAAKARLQTADGQYRDALETCLALRRFSAHVGDATSILWAASNDADHRALVAVKDVLDAMPIDADLLTWLREELISNPGMPWHPQAALKRFAELEIRERNALPQDYEGERENLLKRVKDDAAREELGRLSDAELLVRAQESFDAFLEEAQKIWGRDISLTEQWNQLGPLFDRYGQKSKQGEPIRLLGGLLSQTRRFHKMHINGVAFSNSLFAALEIYLVRARTGQLPDTLPAGLPVDPYTDRPFVYETTETGFLLRCPNVPPEFGWRDGQREFKFKVTP